MSNQQPSNQPQHPPYLQQPPPGYYIPVKTGPSAGKVILWIIAILIAIPIILLLVGIVVAQLT
jgi:hypothetical protein